jgi:hypothetical protein
MRWTSWLMAAALAALPIGALPTAANAVTQDDFLARTTTDLVNLCDPPSADPMRVAALHFCEGFMVGAYQYHQAERAGPKGQRLFCLPSAGVTRDQAVRLFITWAKDNPQYMQEPPVQSLSRFAAATWPCGK